MAVTGRKLFRAATGEILVASADVVREVYYRKTGISINTINVYELETACAAIKGWVDLAEFERDAFMEVAKFLWTKGGGLNGRS